MYLVTSSKRILLTFASYYGHSKTWIGSAITDSSLVVVITDKQLGFLKIIETE